MRQPCHPRYCGRLLPILSPIGALSCSWPIGRGRVKRSPDAAKTATASSPLGELSFRDDALEGFRGALDAVEQVPAIGWQHPNDGAFTARGRETHSPRSKVDGGAHLELMA